MLDNDDEGDNDNEDDNDDDDCEDHLGREPSRAAVSVIAAKLVSSSGTPGERFLHMRQKSAMVRDDV